MNDSWINNSITEYYNWLRDKTQVLKNEESGWFTITTPFLGLFNDYIEIYVKFSDGRLILSDDGQTLTNLELEGASILRSNKRKEWFEMILLNYGVTLKNNEL